MPSNSAPQEELTPEESELPPRCARDDSDFDMVRAESRERFQKILDARKDKGK